VVAGGLDVGLDRHPLVPETVGQPACVGSTDDGAADEGVKPFALGIADGPPCAGPF
jgi:hypothetical protein